MIDQNLKEALDLYVEHGIEPGGFLTACLENNLTLALARADYRNRRNIFEIVSYIYNELPARCWGSREHVEKWKEMKRVK